MPEDLKLEAKAERLLITGSALYEPTILRYYIILCAELRAELAQVRAELAEARRCKHRFTVPRDGQQVCIYCDEPIPEPVLPAPPEKEGEDGKL